MFRYSAIRKELRAAMAIGNNVTIYTVGDQYCGQVLEVGWFWVRLLCYNDDQYASWLLQIDTIHSICAFSRSAKESFYQQIGIADESIKDVESPIVVDIDDQGSGVLA